MVKFVYFDVGGVAIQDFSSSDKWTALKKEIGVTPITHQNLLENYLALQK